MIQKISEIQKKEWIRLHQDGLTPTDIAKATRSNRRNVIYWLLRRGFSVPRKISPEIEALAKQVYEMKRDTRLSWTAINQKLQGSETFKRPNSSLFKMAMMHALHAKLPWPLEVPNFYPDKMKAKWIKLYQSGISTTKIARHYKTNGQNVGNALRAAGIPLRPLGRRVLQDKRCRMAYELRLKKGLTWIQISSRLWKDPGKQPRIAHSAARRYAIKNGLDWPMVESRKKHDPKSAEAYRLRAEERMGWREIGEKLWRKSESPNLTQRSCQAARIHSDRTGLPWPIRMKADPRNEEAYRLRADEQTDWLDIGKSMWSGTASSIVNRAYRAALAHSRRMGLIWPPERSD